MIAVYRNSIKEKADCNAFKRKKCYGKPVWVIFNGDGKPYMSNFKAFSCSTHLSRIINKIMAEENSLTSILDDKDTFSEEEFNVE